MEIDVKLVSSIGHENIERFLPIRAQQGRRRGNDAEKNATLHYTADRKDVASHRKIEQLCFLFFFPQITMRPFNRATFMNERDAIRTRYLYAIAIP